MICISNIIKYLVPERNGIETVSKVDFFIQISISYMMSVWNGIKNSKFQTLILKNKQI